MSGAPYQVTDSDFLVSVWGARALTFMVSRWKLAWCVCPVYPVRAADGPFLWVEKVVVKRCNFPFSIHLGKRHAPNLPLPGSKKNDRPADTPSNSAVAATKIARIEDGLGMEPDGCFVTDVAAGRSAGRDH